MLRADLDTQARVREAEFAFMVKLEKLDFDLARMHGADHASTRQREKALGGYANPVLADVVIAWFFGVVGYVLTGQAQMESAFASGLVGYVSAIAEQVIAYYFGPSSGSKYKTEIVGKAFGRGG